MNPEQNPLPPVAPVTQPMIPAPEPPKSNNKIVMALVGIVVVLLLVIGGFVFAFTQMQKPTPIVSPTPTSAEESQLPLPSSTPPVSEIDTSDWERYTNTRSNFEIKYPSSWTGKSINPGPPASEPDPESYGFTVFPSIYDGTIDAKNYISIETDGIGNIAFKNFEDWLDKLATQQYYTVEGITQGKINQISATIFTGTYGGYGFPAKIKSYFFSSIDKETYYSIFVVTETSDPYSDEINQILSTFEFTN